MNSTLDPQVGLQRYQICMYDGSDDGGLVGSAASPGPTATPTCAWVNVYATNKIFDGWTGGYALTNDNQKSSAATSSSMTSNTSLVRQALSAKPTSSPSGETPKNITVLGTAVLPFDLQNRISFELADSNIVQSLGITSTNSIAQSLKTLDTTTSDASGLAFDGTNNSDNDFGTIDADVAQRLVPNPYRDFGQASISNSDARAFASTSILDLKPFDSNQIAQLAFGSTFSSVDNDNNTFDILYFRDGTQNASGALIHGDRTLYLPGGNISLGYSHTTANDAYASTGLSNRYLTEPDPTHVAFPTTEDAPISHSRNDIAGLAYEFGASADNQASVQHDFTLFGRYGTNGIGHDATAALSFQNTGLGTTISGNGTSLSNSLIAGERDISYTYDPLLTPYDMLSGNRIYFARAASTVTQPRCSLTIEGAKSQNTQAAAQGAAIDKGDSLSTCPIGSLTSIQSSVAFSLVRANDGNEDTYSANGIVLDAAINPQFKVDAVYLDSQIAGSVEGRTSGKYVIIKDAATNLLSNNASSLSLTFKDGKYSSISAGLALADTPTCKSATVCTSPFSRSFTSSGSFGYGLVHNDFATSESTSPGSLQAGQGASNVIASNALISKALGMYHFCQTGFDVAPSISYSNAIPGTGSQFTPGNVTVASLDIAFNSQVGIRVSNTVTTVAPGIAFKLPTHSFNFSILSTSQMIWNTIGKVGSLKCVKQT